MKKLPEIHKKLSSMCPPGMVYVPGGEFLMGSNEGEETEKPMRKVFVDSFYIDKYPVTFGEFTDFIEKTGYESRSGWQKHWSEEKKDHPIVSVSWQDAWSYAKWVGKYLPTEAEWEKAARGTDGRIWPWGNEWDQKKLNSVEGGPCRTVSVGSYPEGASPSGVMDMAGQVWEWTDSREMIYKNKKLCHPHIRIIKGGSWSSKGYMARCSFRHRGAVDGWQNDAGFRCVKLLTMTGR